VIESIEREKRKLCMIFIDQEKAYDSVPIEVLKWAFMKKDLPKAYVNINKVERPQGLKALLVKLRIFYGWSWSAPRFSIVFLSNRQNYKKYTR